MTSSRLNRLGQAPGSGAKEPCRTVATTNVTLSGLQTIGSVTLVADDRILLTGQTDGTEDGIYDVSTGAWTRATDWNADDDVVSGVMIPIQEPAAVYQVSFSGAHDLGVTEYTFTQFLGTTGATGLGAVLRADYGDQAGETTLSLPWSSVASQLLVFVGGVKQSAWTLPTSSSISFTNALPSGIVEIYRIASDTEIDSEDWGLVSEAVVDSEDFGSI